MGKIPERQDSSRVEKRIELDLIISIYGAFLQVSFFHLERRARKNVKQEPKGSCMADFE